MSMYRPMMPISHPTPMNRAPRTGAPVWRRVSVVVGAILSMLVATAPVQADQVIKLSAEQRAGIPLKTEEAQASDKIPVTSGLVRVAAAASDQASQRVMAPLGGQLSGDLPSQGDTVKAGQVLVRISSAQLAEYLGQWQSASADELAARQALERDKALFAEGLIPRKRLESAQATARMAQAHLSAMRAQLATAGVPDPAKLDASALRGAEIEVKAPISGVITQRSVMPGDRVTQGAPLFEITSVQQQWWLFSVSPDQLPPQGTPLWLNVTGCSESAKVRLVDLAVNSATQMITIRAKPVKACATLRPGQYVDATLMEAAEKPAIVVPQVALTQLEGQQQVYVERDGAIHAIQVAVLGRGNGAAYLRPVTAGALQAGDAVVTQGISRLKAFELGMGGE